MNKIINTFFHFIGLSSNKTGHVEKLVSGLGAGIAIFLILVITRKILGEDAYLIVASMGASAVLLFAVPHGPLSQPWALVGGHLISAFIGVSCYLLIPSLFVAAACAVGVAISVMYYLRCIHPPGGATALSAVVASSKVHALGYLYMIEPVLINVAVIFSTALLFNFLFHWRRYPAALMHYTEKTPLQDKIEAPQLQRDDLEYALRQMNLYIDVDKEDLERIYQLARNRGQEKLSAEQIRIGHYYSNGQYGNDWCVRLIVDESGRQDPEQDKIIYKVVAGKGRRGSGVMSRQDFAEWAKYEVYRNETSWQRMSNTVGVN